MGIKETVLVTGGSGFIASHCIIQLAAAGYKIKATVRDLSRTNKLSWGTESWAWNR